MVKVYVGGVNAVSGEPAVEDAGTRLRRQAKQGDGGSLQDYIVVPGQLWLNGIADSDGVVPQFVAMPFGSSYSVKSQVTGKDAAGGRQIEVTPYAEPELELVVPSQRIALQHKSNYTTWLNKTFRVFVRTLMGHTLELMLQDTDTISDLKG